MDRSHFKNRNEGNALIVGRQPVLEALTEGRQLDKIFFQQQVSGDSIGRIRELARQAGVPIQQVPVEKLNRMTRTNHQGVIAMAALLPYSDLQEVIDQTLSNGQVPLFLMLDGITDVRNIGAMARTALCCGAQGMIIPDKGVGALNEEAIKASAGALGRIHICRVNSLMKAVDLLHLNGIRVLATEMTARVDIAEADLQLPVCFVMGSEDKGVYPALLKICDEQVKIPMMGEFESLNVSVAAGMILYETMMQRRRGKNS